MEAPQGHMDLLADAEELLRQQEEALARKRAELERQKAQHGDGEVLDQDPHLVANLPEKEVWKHDTITFMGEVFEVRKPLPQALAAFSLASSKYISPEMQTNMVGLFIKQHLSAASHERVYERMMDPEDPDFSPTTLGELMRTIATLGTARPTVPSQP